MPTKNRPELVERALRYYRAIGMDVTIVIADGSDRDRADLTAKVCRDVGSGLRTEHLVCGPEKTVWERILIGLEQTTTPFVVFAADDDYLVPAGVRLGVGRLVSEPSASAAVGFALWRGAVRRRSGDCVSYGIYEQGTRLETTAWERLAAHGDFEAPLFYSLRRTDVARDTWRRIVAAGLDEDFDLHFGELLDSALQLVSGRVIAVDALLLVREFGHAERTSVRFSRDPLARMRDPRWHQRVRLFEMALASALRDARPAPSDPEAVSRDYFDHLMARQLLHKLSRRLAPPADRAHRYRGYLPFLWPPTLLRHLLWSVRKLPRTARDVKVRLRPEDHVWLRRIDAFANIESQP